MVERAEKEDPHGQADDASDAEAAEDPLSDLESIGSSEDDAAIQQALDDVVGGAGFELRGLTQALAQVVPAELLQLVAAAGFLLIGGRLLWAATVNQGTTPS